ncbi:hypothetical protein BHU72_00015 [Desulfuribacillus stibiiarsenatis]|uniref:Copper amine oxidase-like N-terminal domain-containing protein n=1 Tax=Desulfuribacillus stibiiarsenatis TaxID=1390249 RepID=A0A1E5L9M2_9FIRM|nr:stalk domain-containing protein [Desulfuribacillus stibiiarsenatis]OEH86699.1 hypothetical protein BHU72_00015 [Desulfuribacillus stibiiarsenatis]
METLRNVSLAGRSYSKLGMALVVLVTILISSVWLGTYHHVNAQAIEVYLDGDRIQLDVSPVTIQGRALVPMRAIFEALGAEVEWDHSTQTAKASKNTTQIILVRDQNQAWANSKQVILDVPARTINGRLMVPLRFISESLGMGVAWNDKLQRIDLTSEVAMQSWVSFGDTHSAGIIFDTRKQFTDNTPIIHYNVTISLSDQEVERLKTVSKESRWIPLRTVVTTPNGKILLDRIDHTFDLSNHDLDLYSVKETRPLEVRTHAQIPAPTAITSQNISKWELGIYRIEFWGGQNKVGTDTFEIIPTINQIGLSSANMYNGGLVARQGDILYYVGEDGALYKGEIQDSSKNEKLTEERASFLNVQGQWVYFINVSREQVISRIRFDGKRESPDNPWMTRQGEPETLSHDQAGQLLLIGDWMYFTNLTDQSFLYRMKTDGSKKELLLAESMDQFYIRGNELFYTRKAKKPKDEFKDRNPNMLRDYQFQPDWGYVYRATLSEVAGTVRLTNIIALTDFETMGFIIDGDSLYVLKNAGNYWDSRISGRIPGKLYRIALSSSNSATSVSDNTGSNRSSGSMVAQMVADDVVNFHVDNGVLYVQKNLNRGRVIYLLNPEGTLIREFNTQVIRRVNDVPDNVQLYNRGTFPVTYMNVLHNWLFYYAGKETEKITDNMPLRTDERLTVRY